MLRLGLYDVWVCLYDVWVCLYDVWVCLYDDWVCLYDDWVCLYDDWVCLYDVLGVACMCFPPLSLRMRRACMVDLIVESGGFWEGDLWQHGKLAGGRRIIM
jgi:hypothetical protein